MPVVGTIAYSYYLPASNFPLDYKSLSGQKISPKGSMQSTYSSETGKATGYYSTVGRWHSLSSAQGIAVMQSLVNSFSGELMPAYWGAYAKAYGKLQEDLGAQAQNLTAIAEMSSSLEMITKRITSMTKAYAALKKGRFRDFLNLLSVQEPLRKHRRTRWTNSQEASALWLEYWFGWAPAVMDIYTSLELLYNLTPFVERSFEAKGSGLAWKPFTEDKAPGSYNSHSWDAKVYVRLSGTVTVSNPNLFLAARLGLLNPMSTALELVPFSWLLNWVSNVGGYVSAWSDDFGLTYTNTMQTVHCKVSGSNTWSRSNGAEQDGFLFTGSKTKRFASSIRRPPLMWNFPDRLSVTRAATAASLFVLLFSPDAPKADLIKRKI